MSLLNKAEVKRFIMDKAALHRPGWRMTQISNAALVAIEAKLSNMITNAVKSHATRGKTFKDVL
jgi:hypothetical protein